MHAIVCQRSQPARGTWPSSGPDQYVTVQVVPDGVEPLSTLRRDVAHKRGIQLIHCGEGYSGSDGPRSRLGQAMAYANALARGINQPEAITAAEVLAARNTEVARVLLEAMGLERFTLEAQAEVTDRDVDGAGQPRELLRIPAPGIDERAITVVRVTCPSTGHQYLLQVPPAMRTCQQAVAWTFGLDPERYRPEVET